MLTGKCKEDFEKWYPTRQNNRFENTGMTLVKYFHGKRERITDFSMQYGVYVDFFDSVGLRIEILIAPIYNTKYAHKFDYTVYTSNDEEHGSAYEFDTRLEATTQAIEKANEIYNQK